MFSDVGSQLSFSAGRVGAQCPCDGPRSEKSQVFAPALANILASGLCCCAGFRVLALDDRFSVMRVRLVDLSCVADPNSDLLTAVHRYFDRSGPSSYTMSHRP